MLPSLKTTILACVDPRVDPGDLFGLAAGEAAVIRNIGGRVFPSTLQTLAMLGMVAKLNGEEVGPGWNLIVLHHTDCGINCLAHSPELLAKHFGVEMSGLAELAITDPYQSVAVDVTALKANPQLAAGICITGMVYDLATGKVDVVLPNQTKP
ncbi:carbonic anhydrase [Haloferula sp. BvORR071]|uniref:carbonic anhydrase n=1 Tax=Haloferula sp. BvORR071 TaxID=1396141 RepID=UPI002240F362|nr:carbonic anhydrase [Haloferula sp. BvORR071]